MSAKHDFRNTRTIQLLRALVEAHADLMDHAGTEIDRYGLATSEFDCLVTLGVAQPLRMCDLAQKTLLTKSHTTQVMKGLETRGLVKRERNPQSEREVLASLTPAGEELFNRVYPVHFEWLVRFFDERLSEADQEALTALLRKLFAGG